MAEQNVVRLTRITETGTGVETYEWDPSEGATWNMTLVGAEPRTVSLTGITPDGTGFYQREFTPQAPDAPHAHAVGAMVAQRVAPLAERA